MAILFVGSEDTSFEISGPYNTYTFGSTYTSRMRQSIYIATGTTLTAPFAAPAGRFWLSFHFLKHGGISAAPLLRLYDGTRLRLSLNSTATGALELNNGAALATSAFTITPEVRYRVDMLVDLAGTVQVYVDQTLVLDYSGAVATGGSTTLSSMVFSNPSSATSGNDTNFSEVIVQTGCTRRARLFALIPSAIDTASWTGSVDAIREQKADTTALSANVSGALANVALLSVAAIPGNAPLRAVVESARVSGEDSILVGLRTGTSAPRFDNPEVPTSDAYQNINYVHAVNPFTGAPWTTSDLNSLSFSLKLSDSGINYVIADDGSTISDENGNLIAF